MAKQSFRQQMTSWMHGRNGSDELGITAVGFSLVLVLINILVHSWVLSIIGLVPLLYACWRISSRNVTARRAENYAFLKGLGSVVAWLKNPAASIKEMRTYRHYSCPSCNQRVRVPRGKGRIRITCPKCGQKFDAES